MNRKQRRAEKGGGTLVPDASKLIADAVALHQAGRLAEAERAYKAVLARDPNNIDGLHLLGVVAYQSDQPERAAELIGEAVRLVGTIPLLHCNLARAQAKLKQIDRAIQSFRNALAIDPKSLDALKGLGGLLMERGARDEAIALFRRAVELSPGDFLALGNLGHLLTESGQFSAALPVSSAAVRASPDRADLRVNLGAVFAGLHQLDEAELCLREALRLDPASWTAHNAMGEILARRFRLSDALTHFGQAVRIDSKQALPLANLANCLLQMGRVEEALTSYERALSIAPDFTDAHSCLLAALNYPSGLSPAAVHARHVQWGDRQRTQQALKRPQNGFALDLEPGRQLRIGYLSPDFRRHSVAYFLAPLLQNHDRSNFSIYCYSDVERPDSITEGFKSLANSWRSVRELSDEDLAQQIRSDKIDILVDLAGHTKRNRMGCFSLRSAPVQISWLGYPHSTGTPEIDYRIVDAVTDPEGAEAFASERLLRLTPTFLCYAAPGDAPPPEPPPSLARGYVTFGSFNNISKLSAATLDSWSRILLRTPNSRLVMKSGALADEQTSAEIRRRFTERGVSSDRLTFNGWLADPREHLQAYGEIDVALDTFPYNGTTTTCEALWMGVPVVTIAGDRHSARVGASIVSALGLSELAADDVEKFEALCVSLADDVTRRAELRASLRSRFAASPLADAVGFAARVEAAYRSIWLAWRDSQVR